MRGGGVGAKTDVTWAKDERGTTRGKNPDEEWVKRG